MNNINRSRTCCFSGHRPEKLPWGTDETDPRCGELKKKIQDAAAALYWAGIRHYIFGMARGCDMYFAEEIIRLRDEYPGVTLEAAIPCETQAAEWTEDDRNRYFYIAQQCDFETLLQGAYTADCMIKRNRYMVDNSAVLIAVFDGTLGGTMQTVNYAKKQGLEIVEIHP